MLKVKPLQVLSGALFVTLSCSGGCHRSANTPAASSTGGSLERVIVAKPERKTLVLTTSQPARIEAFEETPIYAKLSGFVEKVHVDIGDQVKAGQSLVALSIPELVDEVAQKTALVAQAEAEVIQTASHTKSAKAAADTAKAKIAEARAGITRASGEYERWKAELERIKSLAGSGSVTEKLVDETQNQLQAAIGAREQAMAAVQSAEAASAEAETKVEKAKADELGAAARLRVARADLARANTMLGYTEIKSPFDGIVTMRSIDTGHFVQPAGGAGTKPLMTVARTDRVRVFMDIPEMEAAQVDVGDEATLNVQALRGQQLKAKVSRTSWSLDPTNRSLRAEIDIENKDSLLRPGMYANGAIQLAIREKAVVVPASAVFRLGADSFCARVESGKIVRDKVELGLRSGLEIEILEGISDDSEVVVTGADSLQPGQEVEIATAKP
jgi:RND family efflux transporter MFP subunit